MSPFFTVLAWLSVPLSFYIWTQAPRVIKYVAQIIVDASKLEIQSVTITQCDEHGFLLSMTTRIYDTGPVPATIHSMTLAMHSSSGGPAFATVKLPTITAVPGGVICKIVDQRVDILNYEAFHVFNRNLVLQAELPVTVNGASTLTTSGLSTKIVYNKTSILQGFDGVRIKPRQSRKHSRSLLQGRPSEIEVDVSIYSKSEVRLPASWPILVQPFSPSLPPV